jgi:hypothetical protein
MLPLMEKYSDVFPWIGQIIEFINKDDNLAKKFYSDMRKDKTVYTTIRRTKNENGSTTVAVFPVNKSNTLTDMFDSANSMILNGYELSNYSVYDTNGAIKANNEDLNNIIRILNNFKKELNERNTSIEKAGYVESHAKVLGDILRGIGINFSDKDIITPLIHGYKEDKTLPVYSVVETLVEYVSKLKGEAIGSKLDIAEKGKYVGFYNRILTPFAKLAKTDYDDMCYEAGRSRYTYLIPQYIEKIRKRMVRV